MWIYKTRKAKAEQQGQEYDHLNPESPRGSTVPGRVNKSEISSSRMTTSGGEEP